MPSTKTKTIAKRPPAKKITKYCVKAPKDPIDAQKNPFAFISTQMREKAAIDDDTAPFVIEGYTARIIAIQQSHTVPIVNINIDLLDKDGELYYKTNLQYINDCRSSRKLIQANSVIINETDLSLAIEEILKSEKDAAEAQSTAPIPTSILDLVTNQPINYLGRDNKGDVITALGDSARRTPQIEYSGSDHTPEACIARILHPIVMMMPERQKMLRLAIIDKFYLSLPCKDNKIANDVELPELNSPEAKQLWITTARKFCYVFNGSVEAFLSPETDEPIRRESNTFVNALREEPELTMNDVKTKDIDALSVEDMTAKLMFSLSFDGVESSTENVIPQDYRLFLHVDVKTPFYKALVGRLLELATLLVGTPPPFLVKYALGEVESFMHADVAGAWFQKNKDVIDVLSMDDCSTKSMMAALAKSSYRNPSVENSNGKSSVLFFASNSEKASANALFSRVGIHDLGEGGNKTLLNKYVKARQEVVLDVMARALGIASNALVLSSGKAKSKPRKAKPESESMDVSTLAEAVEAQGKLMAEMHRDIKMLLEMEERSKTAAPPEVAADNEVLPDAADEEESSSGDDDDEDDE